MIQPGERALDAGWLVERLGLWLRFKAALLRSEVRLGSSDLARVGLVALAVALQTIVLASPGHFRPADSAFFAILVCLATLAGLGLCLAATLPQHLLFDLRVRQLLGVAAIIALGILCIVGVGKSIGGAQLMMEGTPYSNDGAVMDLASAQRVLAGHDPYEKSSIVLALATLNAPATTVTPLMEGQFRGAPTYPSEAAIQQAFLSDLRYRPRAIPPEFESKYNYPTGSFLFILPFVAAGFHDMRLLYVFVVLLFAAYLWWRMPRSLRFLAPFIVLADVPLIVLTAGGQPDPIYGFFLMVGYGEWRRRWTSSTAMGLAVGTKQLAWFFLPFYAVVIYREYGLRETLRRIGVIALVSGLMNLPWALQSPGAFASSVWAPMIDPMFPLGIGIIALFVSGILPMLPKIAFTLMEVGSWLGSATVFARWRVLTPASGVVLAALPMFFAWRSLASYFYLVPLLALAVTFAGRHQSGAGEIEGSTAQRLSA